MKKIKNLKIVNSVIIAVVIALIFGVGLNLVTTSTRMNDIMSGIINNQLNERLIMQENIINTYIQDAEDYLIQFSTAPLVKDVIMNGEGNEEIQQYIADFVATANNVENIYVSDFNSKVLASYVEPVIGKTLREGEALSQLQEELKNGMYNTGIMASKATGQQVISMYYPVISEDKIIGYVGAAIYSQNLQDTFNHINQNVLLVDAISNNYIFNVNADLIGTPVEDKNILDIVSEAYNGSNVNNKTANIYDTKMVTISKKIEGRDWILVAYMPYNEAFNGVSVLQKTLILTNIGTFILCIIMLILGTKFALKNVNKIISICDSLGSLNLTTRTEFEQYTDDRTEVGLISKSIGNLLDSIIGVLNKVKSNEQSLYDNVASVKTHVETTNNLVSDAVGNIKEISQGATNQAYDIQSATEEVIEIGRLIEQNNNQLQLLKSNSDSMCEASNTAMSNLDILTGMCGDTEDAIKHVNEQMKKTQEATDEIKNATEIITAIAEETNLLALNASIEAARVGEAGRGFSVVAEQIKRLSEQSNNSAKQIQTTISSLVKEVEETMDTIISVSNTINEQNDNIYKTKKSFEGVNECIEYSLEQIKQAAEDNNTLDSKRSNIIDLVSNLSAIAEENLAMSESSVESMNKLSLEVSSILNEMNNAANIADELKENVDIFTL